MESYYEVEQRLAEQGAMKRSKLEEPHPSTVIRRDHDQNDDDNTHYVTIVVVYEHEQYGCGG